MREKSYARGAHPDLPPPVSEVGLIGWCRKNLFATPADTIFTILAVYVLYIILPGFVQWAFIDAIFVAANSTVANSTIPFLRVEPGVNL